MKKTLFFTLILTICALLCSCNLDAQDGIHSAIASSIKESGTKIQSYLGYHDGHHYILTDTSIIRVGDESALIDLSNTSTKADYAALLSDGTFLVRRHDAKVVKYNADGTEVGVINENLKCNHLFSNGLIVGDENGTTGLFDSTGAIKVTISNMQSFRQSGEYTLIETKATDEAAMYYIYKGNAPSTALVSVAVGKDLSGSFTLGFQAISDTEFYVLKGDFNVYSITVDGSTASISKFTSIGYSIPSDKAYSFNYSVTDTESSTTTRYIVFKASGNFVRINLDKASDITTVTSGYGTLKQTEVVNILPDEEKTGTFIVATSSNSLWRIDPTTTDDPVDMLK